MNTTISKNLIAGLVAYVACIGAAALPIFSSALSLTAVLELGAAGVVASLLVIAVRYSRIRKNLKDPLAMFTQALLGIAICGGLYSVVSSENRPEIITMAFMMWTAMGLMQFTPSRVGALFALYLGIYLNAFSQNLFLSHGTPKDAEVVFMLLAASVMGAFMTWRAYDYTLVRGEKVRLQDENTQKSEKIKEVEARIHAITIQDLDTIALKYPYFKNVLMQEKARADRHGGKFSIGLIAIDHFAEVSELYGEIVAKQLLREFADRATKLIRSMDFLDVPGDSYHPLGRVGDGLFGLILPGADLKGAERCAQRLQNVAEFRNIRTAAGQVHLSLSIGIVEYARGEDVERLMSELGNSLEKARLNHADGLQAGETPRATQAPVTIPRSLREMSLLDFEDYSRPVH